LKTKEGLTYDDVCERLIDLVSTSKKIIEEDTALYRKAKGNNRSNKESKGKEKEVYYTVSKDNRKKERVWQSHHTKHYKSKKTDEVTKVAASDNDSDLTLIATNYALASSSNFTGSQYWKWILDTGYSSHMTGNKVNLFNLRPYSRRIKGISGRYIMATYIGDTNIIVLYPDSTTKTLKIENILSSSELNCSLMS
jgi:hypothetical protein